MGHFLLGIDIGSSSIKASIVDAKSRTPIATCQSPDDEFSIEAVSSGWAEQDPEVWWYHARISIAKCIQDAKINGSDILAIGISYQMHGLVLVDKDQKPLRDSIIWCDSRAVAIGEKAFRNLGEQYCLKHLLNSPGNFTASKLKWVKENEPEVFDKIYKIMLPGDFIAMKLTGEIVSTDTGMSEGIFWDYTSKKVSNELLTYYGFNSKILPDLKPVFSDQGKINSSVAEELGINKEASVTYRAGDQPNNAFSLGVLHTGETAATAGTSGVIYSVTDKNTYDPQSRVNTFVHVNNTPAKISNGVLLCINGTGILNSWLRRTVKNQTEPYSYQQMNKLSAEAPIGSDGLFILPFGNGAERVLQNKQVNASFLGLDFNRHSQAHIFRAAQEGIVFALRYGFDVLQSIGLQSSMIRAGFSSMFLSPLFREVFVSTIGTPLQLLNTDGATGAAIGAGIGAGLFNFDEAFSGLSIIEEQIPVREKSEQYNAVYTEWKARLEQQLQND